MNNDSDKPTWYILGAGAIGLLWAAYWRKSGFPVVLVAPSKRASQSLRIRSSADSKEWQSYDIDSITIDELAENPIDIHHLLVSTKAQHTLSALESIRPCITDNATIIVLQNGMAVESVKQVFHQQKIVTAVSIDGAYRDGQMSVTHAGHGTTYLDAEESLLNILPRASLQLQIADHIFLYQWKKLTINCAINPLTVIYQCNNGSLLDIPDALERSQKVCSEIQNLITAMKPELSDEFTTLYEQVLQTMRTTADNFSSMYQDVAHQRETEIDMLNGYVCQQAKQFALPCHETQALYDAVKHKELQYKY